MTTARKVTATLSTKGRLTLPKVVRERLGVTQGGEVEFVISEQGVSMRSLQPEANPFLMWLARTPAPTQASQDIREARHAGLSAEERRLLQAGPGARLRRLSDPACRKPS